MNRDARRIMIRGRLVAVARACGHPEGIAPTAREFQLRQRALDLRLRVTVYQVMKHGGGLAGGGWRAAVRSYGLQPAIVAAQPSNNAIIEDVVRVANLGYDPRVCPTPAFYRLHGEFAYTTVLKICPPEERNWYRVAIEAGLEPRSVRYGDLTRDAALFDLRRFAQAQGIPIGGPGPSEGLWRKEGPYSPSRIRQPRLFTTWAAFLEAGGFEAREEPTPLAIAHLVAQYDAVDQAA